MNCAKYIIGVLTYSADSSSATIFYPTCVSELSDVGQVIYGSFDVGNRAIWAERIAAGLYFEWRLFNPTRPILVERDAPPILFVQDYCIKYQSSWHHLLRRRRQFRQPGSDFTTARNWMPGRYCFTFPRQLQLFNPRASIPDGKLTRTYGTRGRRPGG